MGNLPLDFDEIESKFEESGSIECGRDVLKHFGFDDNFKNLNHGSFGSYPRPIRDLLRRYQDECEARPDEFIRYTYPKLLDKSRETMAKYLNAPVEACVFVPNATTGINTILGNLVYQPRDVILHFNTIYGSCAKIVNYLEETTVVESHKIDLNYPASDDEVCSRFEGAIEDVRSGGQHPRIAVFDTITSLPGLRVPYQRLTEICRKHGVLSCIDGAHGVGHIPLDLKQLDPDFFVSNNHKWLFTPRGCTILYVPVRHQHLIRSTLPTSHGFVPKNGKEIFNPMPPTTKSEFVNNFEYVGTLDSTPYLCVPAVLQWRSRLTFDGKQGEEAIIHYSQSLARQAGKVVSHILGTEIMENRQQSLGECNFTNVRLPLSYEGLAGSDFATAFKIAVWVSATLKEYGTFMALLVYEGAWWVRLSATIYLTIEDFEWAGDVLMQVCERVKQGEWKGH